MTSPSQSNDQSQQSGQQSTPKLRTGQLVTFRHPDPIHPKGEIEGHGIVLTVSEDGATATIAPLSLLHLSTSADNITPAKAADIVPTVQQPEPSSATS